MVSGLVLAAGSSRRFGKPKLVEPFGGEALVRHATQTLLDAGLDVVVVTGRDAGDVRRALAGLDVTIIDNDRAAEGMASSIRCGVAALQEDSEAVVILPGDQPGTPGGLVRKLCRRFREGGAAAVAPLYRGTPGPPSLFSRALFPDLMALRGDRGARGVLQAHVADVVFIEMNDPMPHDIDTRLDHETLESERDPLS